MYSDADTLKGWVAPFGHLGINACSRLPLDFRSVPRPSSPPGAKASTRCPSLAQNHRRHSRNTGTRTGTIQHTENPGRNPGIPRIKHSRRITHFIAPEHCNHIALGLSTTGTRPGQTTTRRRHGHTSGPTPPRTRPMLAHTPAPKKPPELSCASRDATEPDSQSPKNTEGSGRNPTPGTPKLGSDLRATRRPNHSQTLHFNEARPAPGSII